MWRLARHIGDVAVGSPAHAQRVGVNRGDIALERGILLGVADGIAESLFCRHPLIVADNDRDL